MDQNGIKLIPEPKIIHKFPGRVYVCVCLGMYVWDIWVERSVGSGLAELSHFLCFRILEVLKQKFNFYSVWVVSIVIFPDYQSVTLFYLIYCRLPLVHF